MTFKVKHNLQYYSFKFMFELGYQQLIDYLKLSTIKVIN